MAYEALTPLATYTSGSTDTFINFANIPTTDANGNSIRDLRLIYDWPSTTGDHYTRIRVNSNSGSIYRSSELSQFNNNVGCYSRLSDYIYPNGPYGSAGGACFIDILSYSNTDTHKMFLSQSSLESSAHVYAWNIKTTSPISSIQIDLTGGGTFNGGYIFSLYGIAGD